MKQLVISILVAAVAPVASGQSFDMSQWGAGRGYTEAPYTRYEAEEGRCASYSGNMLQPSDNQTLLQSEASNSRALTLEKPGDYVSWVSDSGDADGLTLRFSVAPGSKARVGVFVADSKLGELSLTADHSWQYCVKIPGRRDYKPEIYSIHTVNPDEFARMRFDEVHTRLSRAISRGETFSLRLIEGNDATVDFVETEFCRKVEPQSGWAVFNGGDLQAFINANQGHTVYIDVPLVELTSRLNLGSASLRGAGMWFTELRWTGGTAGFNGFSGEVADLYLSSYQNQRYNSPDHGPGTYSSPGKCFNATAGRVTNVWVEHFECGGWLGGASGARFSHCRFRNNYADGINLCNSSDCRVEQSSFRNNGDDDMASWSAESYCSNNVFANCTAEHNWRASSLGFFGGGGHRAENILVKDGLESGVRLVSDFGGKAFGNEGIVFSNISIVHCACVKGDVGVSGDFWGVDEGALHIEASKNYSIPNAVFENFDIYDSRGNAVFVGAWTSNSHSIDNLRLTNINVHGVADSNSYAFYFENPRGSATVDGATVDGVEQLTNLDGGELVSGRYGSFELTALNIEAGETVDIPSSCRLSLAGLSWSRAGRAAGAITDTDEIMFSVRVDNVSDSDFPSDVNIPVSLTLDNGSEVSTKFFPAFRDGLPRRGSAVLRLTSTLPAGGVTLTAALDPNSRYGEVTSGSADVTKRLNVMPDLGDKSYTPTSGIDFQVLDLVWNTTGSKTEFGKGTINEGDHVYFAARVVNAGSENSATAVKLGVAFRQNGVAFSQGSNGFLWCDDGPSREPLAAGEQKLFPVNSGAAGRDYWVADRNCANFLIHVNDDGSRDETDKSNNTRTCPLAIPYAGPSYFSDSEVDNPDDLTTAIISAAADAPADGRWYTLTGVILPGIPTAPGIYVCGRRVVAVTR